MENLIIWNDIREIQPKEGQEILYSYSYEYAPNKWEHRVMLDTYSSSKMHKFPICYMTDWTEAPEPVKRRRRK